MQKHKAGADKVPIKLTDTQEQPEVGEFQERLQSHMEEFAEHLDTARTIWQKYPELVEAREFPEPFLRAFSDRNANEMPGFTSLFDELLVEHGLLKVHTPENREKTLQELRVATKGMTGSARDEHLAAAFDSEMETGERAHLTVCQRILREWTGMDSPFEEFVYELLLLSSVRAVTRADVYARVAEFDFNWRDAVKIARKFYSEHINLMTADELPRDQDPDAEHTEAQEAA